MKLEQIGRNIEKLERYFDTIAKVSVANPNLASSIFELNSSAYGGFVKAVLDETLPHRVLPTHLLIKSIIIGSLRYWARFAYLFVLRYSIRGKQQLRADMTSLESAEVIFAGHMAQRNGQFHAKDFTGFMEAYCNQNIAVLGQRLPHISWRDYFSSKDFIPVEAHMHILDAIKIWFNYLIFIWSVRLSKVAHECCRDFSGARAQNSTVYAHTATRLIRAPEKAQQLFIPLERHDWECLLLTLVKSKLPQVTVSLVQNCTFSIHDANMYIVPNAPTYKKILPDCCYVIDKHWQEILKHMGLHCPFEIMLKHRFSDGNESLRFDHSSNKILYLGSINPLKVELDLQALATLPQHFEIHVRLHPSLSQVMLPSHFKRVRALDEAYAWCIHADTTMAVFLRTEEDRFIFIDHPSLLNQNPLPVLHRKGKNCLPDQLVSLINRAT